MEVFDVSKTWCQMLGYRVGMAVSLYYNFFRVAMPLAIVLLLCLAAKKGPDTKKSKYRRKKRREKKEKKN